MVVVTKHMLKFKMLNGLAFAITKTSNHCACLKISKCHMSFDGSVSLQNIYVF